MKIYIFIFIGFLIPFKNFSQSYLIEKFRREQILNDSTLKYSFNLKDQSFRNIFLENVFLNDEPEKTKNKSFKILPVEILGLFQPSRSFSWGDKMVRSVKGSQFYLSSGIMFQNSFLNIELQPESLLGFINDNFSIPRDFTDDSVRDYYYFFNLGDHPLEFPSQTVKEFWWGQSKVSLRFGSFEIGASTQNFWWGPGQWNSLIFSNNAKGFLHATLNTFKPAKTFIGNFEGQFFVGKLNSSNLEPTLNDVWNTRYFRDLSNEWRYLNGLMFSYNPKWVPNLFLGLSRTVQLYNNFLGSGFMDYFPVFQAFQKQVFFENGNSVEFDQKNQSQQVAVFGRYLNRKSKTELYFEYGRRDHAFNWREFILNPEHARAYNLGFIQVFDLSESSKLLQVRGEVTQQHESINRYIRYNHLDGGDTWHTNGQARGFTNEGQPLGVGLGIGSNSQTLEIALVEEFNKVGLLFQRLENNQAFYYRSFLFDQERKPWVDLSLGFLYDKQFNNLLLSSKLQLIHARNYQWQLDPASTSDFPKGKNLTSVMGQVSAIYFWNKKEKKD